MIDSYYIVEFIMCSIQGKSRQFYVILFDGRDMWAQAYRASDKRNFRFSLMYSNKTPIPLLIRKGGYWRSCLS
jgi:hypothetical protein